MTVRSRHLGTVGRSSKQNRVRKHCINSLAKPASEKLHPSVISSVLEPFIGDSVAALACELERYSGTVVAADLWPVVHIAVHKT